MNKFTYVLLNNLLVIIAIAGLYYLTNSLWSFVVVFFAQSIKDKSVDN